MNEIKEYITKERTSHLQTEITNEITNEINT